MALEVTERRPYGEMRERAFWPVAFTAVGLMVAIAWADRADSVADARVAITAIEQCATAENPTACAENVYAILKAAK